MEEVAAAEIEKPALVAATKADEAADGDVARLAAALEREVVPVSVLDDASLEAFRDAVWKLTGLIRVFLRRAGEDDAEPIALPSGATIVEVADRIHHELAAACTGARVWGPSARFEGQRVGRTHVVEDGAVVEILS